MVFNDSLLGAGFPIIGGNRVNLAMCEIWVYGLGKLFPLCWIYSLVWCLIYFFVYAANCIPGSIRQVEMPFLTHQSTSFFFHNFHVSFKFCFSACNKLFVVNVSNYHIHFFGVPTAVHSEFSFWSVSGTTFCWFTWQSRPCIAAFEEVFIFGCSALLCHSGNFLFWAARGSVAPTLRCIPGNCGLPSLEKRLKKRHILGNRKGCHSRAHTLAVSVSIPSVWRSSSFLDEIWCVRFAFVAMLQFCSCYTNSTVIIY